MQSCEIRLCRAFLEKRRWIRLRTFIAIELEEETKAQLAEVQAEAEKLCRRGNYTPKENFHLTLHFLCLFHQIVHIARNTSARKSSTFCHFLILLNNLSISHLLFLYLHEPDFQVPPRPALWKVWYLPHAHLPAGSS